MTNQKGFTNQSLGTTGIN